MSITSPSTSDTPWQRYQRDLQRTGFIQDPAQTAAVAALETLYQSLLTGERGLMGLYLWGPVGRGKSYLMDSFFAALPPGMGQRLHFHRFMQRIHQELTELSGSANPLQQIARRFARESRVLCFDEFFVSDIGDAMILANLLEGLFTAGVVLVATSNQAPDALYSDGLQRQRFLPAIALLQRHTQALAVDGGVDYRRRLGMQLHHYWHPAGAADAGEQQLRQRCLQLSRGELRWQQPLQIQQRTVATRGWSDNLAWFDFTALCEGPRSQLDYIEISQRFPIVALSQVPVLGGQIAARKVAMGTEDSLDNSIAGIDRTLQQGFNDDGARRFIALVDELYDRKNLLLVSAAAPIEQLYRGGRVAAAFERTISRLIEMQQGAYVESAYRRT